MRLLWAYTQLKIKNMILIIIATFLIGLSLGFLIWSTHEYSLGDSVKYKILNGIESFNNTEEQEKLETKRKKSFRLFAFAILALVMGFSMLMVYSCIYLK